MEIEDLKTLRELAFDSSILMDCKNISDYGDYKSIWDYIISKYGIYKPLPFFQDYTEFKKAVDVMFLANDYKYSRLAKTLVDYDFMKPYNIEEEHTIGEKHSNTKDTQNGSSTVADSETSFDNLTLNPTASSTTTLNGVNTEHTYINSVSETYKDETFSDLTDSMKRKDSRVGNIGNHAISDLAGKERNIANFRLWDEIARDILNLTCYKIFI